MLRCEAPLSPALGEKKNNKKLGCALQPWRLCVVRTGLRRTHISRKPREREEEREGERGKKKKLRCDSHRVPPAAKF